MKKHMVIQEKKRKEKNLKESILKIWRGAIDLGVETAGLDKYEVSELVGEFARIIERIQPNIVILPDRKSVV